MKRRRRSYSYTPRRTKRRTRKRSASKKYAGKGYTRTSGVYGVFTKKSKKELKFFDKLTLKNPVPVAGEVNNLNLVPQGTSQSTRIGRLMTVKSINLNLEYRLNAVSTTAAWDTVRMMLVVDRQANGTTATVTQVLEASLPQAFYNLNNSRRFLVLWDKLLNMNATAAIGTGVATSERGINIRYRKRITIPIDFNNTTGAITEIRSNNIFLLQLSSTGNALTTVQSRIRYYG